MENSRPLTVAQKIEAFKKEDPEILFKPTKEWINENRPISPSSGKAFRKSPQHYLEYLQTPYVPTPAVILGKAVDVAILEPEKFEDQFFLLPDINLRTNAGKEEKAQLIELNQGKTLITVDQYDTAMFCAKSAWQNKTARYYLDRLVKTQLKLSWKDPASEFKNVGYVDGASDPNDQDFFYLELKSAADASTNKFIRDAQNFDYIMQPGGYTLGAKYSRFEFPDIVYLVVETKSPYPVNVLRCDSKYIEKAQNEYLNTLLAIKYCINNDLWHQSYDFLCEPYNTMETPGYFKPKYG